MALELISVVNKISKLHCPFFNCYFFPEEVTVHILILHNTCSERGVKVAVLVLPISEMTTLPSSVADSAGPRHSKNT